MIAGIESEPHGYTIKAKKLRSPPFVTDTFVAGFFQNFVERPFMLSRFQKTAHCILYIAARFFLSLATA